MFHENSPTTFFSRWLQKLPRGREPRKKGTFLYFAGTLEHYPIFSLQINALIMFHPSPCVTHPVLLTSYNVLSCKHWHRTYYHVQCTYIELSHVICTDNVLLGTSLTYQQPPLDILFRHKLSTNQTTYSKSNLVPTTSTNANTTIVS